MTKGLKIFIGIVAGGGLGVSAYYLFNRVKKYQTVTSSEPTFDFDDVADFIISFEGFSATPYWDNSQWTWGYGTAAGYDKNDKPAGTITPAQARADLIDYIKTDYVKLSMALDKPVSFSQMKALLDFSYNLGYDDVHTIVKNINKGVGPLSIADEMRKYVYSAGKVSSDLEDRRDQEAQIYLS